MQSANIIFLPSSQSLENDYNNGEQPIKMDEKQRKKGEGIII